MTGEKDSTRTSQKTAVTGRISSELMELLTDYMESRGYNQSEAVRRLLEEALIKETDITIEQLTELRMAVEDLEWEVEQLDGLQSTVEELQSDIEENTKELNQTIRQLSEKSDRRHSRVTNIEERLERLEDIEWERREDIDAE